jgi:hypothetical protein
MLRIASLITTLWIAITIVACSPPLTRTPNDPWKYSDLRALSPHGDANPDLDIIATYTRVTSNDLQIRLDILNLPFEPGFDVYIALDTRPGGTRKLPIEAIAGVDWDILLVLPASGSPQVLLPDAYDPNLQHSINEPQFPISEKVIPRIIRVPWHDYLIISLNKALLPAVEIGINLQSFITPINSSHPQDITRPVNSESLPPSPAPLLLAFWNTFSAYSPAQALRRWDGAHTGPFGERHGLSILLENAKKTRIPVFLLDLRNPDSLSALEHLGALPLIRELAAEKLIILPDLLPGSQSFPLFPTGLPTWAPSRYLDDLEQISVKFRLNSSNIFYSPKIIDNTSAKYKLVFTSWEGDKDLLLQNSQIFPIPHEISTEPQASSEGLSLAIRKTLLDNALKINLGSDDLPLLILGGSLTESAFGDPLSAISTLSYIAAHPWMEPLNAEGVISLSNKFEPQLLPGTTTLAQINNYSPSEVLQSLPELNKSSENPIYQSAWQAALSLYAPLPPEPADLPELRSLYSGQTGIFLIAADWAENPQYRQDCNSDPDLDELPECILATDQYFAIFDIHGARLLAFYVRIDESVHQIVAPTSQFIVGLADPSTWQIEAAEGADTGGIHGAFADHRPPWELFNPTFYSDSLVFTSDDQRVTKAFTLTSDGLLVKFHLLAPVKVQIPLAIDPWERFSPLWSQAYQGHTIPNGYSWQLDEVLAVEVLSDASLSANAFNASQRLLPIPENPNFDYPQGHYIPFPMAIIEIESNQDFFVEINPIPLHENQ